MVAVLALVFNATAATMNQATRWLELASYALVTLLGAWLVWVKAIRPLLRRRAGQEVAPAPAVAAPMPAAPALKGAAALRAIAVHAPTAPAPAHHHHHDDDCGCGHAHVPAPEQVAGPVNWRRAGSAVLAV
ncbi:hypothetical protein G6F45_014045 [Rhizopus arrhizus]|nr:hypothetical protein G6F45_014045 [Rhizopus arrhizus]